MNEQRQQAYFNLIQRLLSCPNGEEQEILSANYDLVDVGLLQAIQTVVKVFSQRGSEKAANSANRLRNLITQIAQALKIPQSPQTQGRTENLDAYIEFLQQVLQATAESGGDAQVVYPLLENNTDKLDGMLVEILRQGIWRQGRTNRLREAEAYLAPHFFNFSNLIQQFRLGNKASNMEIAITGYKIVLTVYTREAFPQEWAKTHNNLGAAYSERITGEKAENIEQAIAAFAAALSVYTREAFPQEWAMTQNNLGAAYSERIKGETAENIEQAIAAFAAALSVYTREAFPQEWAGTQNNLGVAYFNRITGEKAENIEQAITAYSNALRVYTHETSPQLWAKTQMNLGNAYVGRILGEKAENIEQAIAAFSAALSVYTRQDFPQLWAMTQNNLGPAYLERIRGETAENIEQAITAYSDALRVFTLQHFPRDYAMTQGNLGNAYVNRILGEKVENIEQAITAFSNALRVYTHETSPHQWAKTQNNLGSAYSNRITGERAENIEQAIAAFSAALTVNTREAFPQEWAMTQTHLGNAYAWRIRGERAENIEQAINAHSAALTVNTREAFPQQWAMTQSNLGNAYRHRIPGEQAENTEQARAAYSAKISGENAENIEQVSAAYFARISEEKAENIEQAITAFSAALNVLTRQAFPQAWAKTQISLASAYRERILGERAENLERAIACYQQALEVTTLDAFPEDWAKTQQGLGHAYSNRELGEPAENLKLAIAYYLQALKVYTFDAFPENHATCSWYLGMTYQNTNQFTKAYDRFESAIATGESLRSEIVSGEQSKRKQAEYFNQVYSSMVEVCLELGYKIQAIEYVERSKTRNLVEQILERDSKTIFPSEVVTQLETYRDEIATGQYQIQNGLAENPRILAQHLQQLRQQRNELQNRYLGVGFGFKFDSFQATLDERTAIIEWYILNEKIIAFIVTQKGEVTVWQSQPEDRKALGYWVFQYLLNYYVTKDQWQNSLGEELKKLASILHVDEILNQIPNHCNQLILIPYWFLHLFPLHSLPVSQNHQDSPCLLDLFAGGVGYAPSCQLLQQVQKRQRPDFQSLFAIQNPTKDLNYTDLEVQVIQSYFKTSNVLKKTAATLTAINNSDFNTYHCAHFSCHAYFNLTNPAKSALILANAPVADTATETDSKPYLNLRLGETHDLDKCLTLDKIFTLKLEKCRLVTLSACETGLIDFKNTSDEYIGLPSGFLLAGSPSVVSSLWTVDDLSTSFLMIKFYENLVKLDNLKAGDVAIALKQAQQWLRNLNIEGLDRFLEEHKLQIEKVLAPLRKGQRKIFEESLKLIKQRQPLPFANPYYWAGFTASGR